jgi:hypothetical protein
VSTFYLLPPRPTFGHEVVRFLQSWFPGLAWTHVPSTELAESLGATAGQQPGVYIVFREDLPEGVELQQALRDDFGAEPGDEVVEVASACVRRWRLAG